MKDSSYQRLLDIMRQRISYVEDNRNWLRCKLRAACAPDTRYTDDDRKVFRMWYEQASKDLAKLVDTQQDMKREFRGIIRNRRYDRDRYKVEVSKHNIRIRDQALNDPNR